MNVSTFQFLKSKHITVTQYAIIFRMLCNPQAANYKALAKDLSLSESEVRTAVQSLVRKNILTWSSLSNSFRPAVVLNKVPGVSLKGGAVSPVSDEVRKSRTLPISEAQSNIASYATAGCSGKSRPPELEVDGVRIDSECASCQGLPCRKKTNPGQIAIRHASGNVTYQSCDRYSVDQRRRRVLARRVGIPERYIDITRNDFREDALSRDVAMHVTHGGGVYLHGKPGTGKTLLSAVVAQEALQAGKRVLFRRVVDLIQEFLEIIRNKSDHSEAALLRELYTVDVLVLDDLGAEKASQYTCSLLSKIIDARYNRSAVTLITSNLNLSTQERRLNAADTDGHCQGTRITDRIRSMCTVCESRGSFRS